MTEQPGVKDLIYGERGGALVFMPRHLAVELKSLWDALHSSKTWGELKRRIGVERYAEILTPYFENFYDNLNSDTDLTREQAMERFESLKNQKEIEIGDRAPDGSDAFNIGMVHGLDDGDWPEWPAQEMLNWVPHEIQSRFGHVATSVFNGDFLKFEVAREAAIVDAFHSLGYHCEKNQALIDQASGS